MFTTVKTQGLITVWLDSILVHFNSAQGWSMTRYGTSAYS